MRVIIIFILLAIVGSVIFTKDVIYTPYHLEDRYYKVDKIEPYFKDNQVIYNINSRNKGERGDAIGTYDNLQIIDTVGAFDIGDEIILVPTKR